FELDGADGDRLDYVVRHGNEVWTYSADIDVPMRRASSQIAIAHKSVEDWKTWDFRRGFVLTFGLMAVGIWLASFAALVFFASRISRPIQQLTAGLTELAGGKQGVRVPAGRDDEIGRAIQAFNHMAEQMQQNRDRLVYP